MTKSEAKKWGTAVEGATGGGEALSKKVCGATNGTTTNCGQSTGSQSTTIGAAFADNAATLLSAAGNNISTSGMAIGSVQTLNLG